MRTCFTGPMGRPLFETAVDRFNQLLKSLGKDNPMRERMEQSLRNSTTKTGAQFFEALAGLKRNEGRPGVGGQILEFGSSPARTPCWRPQRNARGTPSLAQLCSDPSENSFHGARPKTGSSGKQAIPALSTRLPVFRPGVSALLLVDGQFGRDSFVRLPPAAVQPPREPAESRCRCGPEGVGKISDGSKTAR